MKNNNTFKRLMKYITSAYKLEFSFVFISILISCIASTAINIFIQVLIDDYITPLIGTANPSFVPLAKMIGTMAAIALVGVIAEYVYGILMAVISQGVQKNIRDEMFTHMQKLPVSYFDTHTYGEVMSYYTNDVDTLRQMLGQSVPNIIANVATVILMFSVMIYNNYILTIVVLVGVFFMFQAAKYIATKSGGYYQEQQTAVGVINGYIEEIVNGQKVVKVFNHEEETKKDFDKLNTNLRDKSRQANTFANILMPIMMNTGNILYLIVAMIGGTMSVAGLMGMTLGRLASFLQMTKGFINPLSRMSQETNTIAMALAGAERIFTFLDEKHEVDNGYVTLINAKIENEKIIEVEEHTGVWAWKHPHSDGTTTYALLEGNVVFDDVDFSYDGKTMVLHDVSLYAYSGQKLAFVGATGAGKTTITNLINRFYDIEDGKIRYDEININKIKKSDLRRSLGMVLQDTNLFTGTVADNIRYGKPEATMEEVMEAAKLANADGFIERLDKGYDTVISGSSESLSQGQRQLLSIARAAIVDPPVMILDEATSSIDTHTEAIVQKGMDGLMEGRTVFVIAHRLSTVRNSNAIIVLDHGRIIERGNHDQLIEQGGRYYQLYTGAFELE